VPPISTGYHGSRVYPPSRCTSSPTARTGLAKRSGDATLRPAMALLFIPWFKLEPWHIPVPVLDQIPIQPFGILVAIGVLLGAKVAEEWAKRNEIHPAVVADF